VRRGILAIAGLACALTLVPATTSAANTDLRTRLTGSLRSPALSLGRTGAIALDARTGAVLYAHNASLPVAPASNEKVPVSWAALQRLGPGFRFRTEVLGAGARVGSTWRGDLFLKGYGDPTLSAQDVARLAAAVRRSGVTRVTGWIRGDESVYDGRRDAPGWKPSFVGIETPPLSALVVERARGWGREKTPPLVAARLFRQALVARGVQVAGPAGLGTAPESAELLAVDHSAALRGIVRSMNTDSDNFTAEMVLKQLGTLDGGNGSTAAGAREVMTALTAAGIPTAGVRIVDGSGLSSLDRLTARALADVIRVGIWDERIGPAFLASFAVAGRTGTLETRMPSLTGVVRGKTGTTNMACSLAGLIRGDIVFAVLQNGSPVAFWPARVAQDRFVTTLAKGARTGGASSPP
jgi:D-alanyl-D-alanine carboxypeptidase/D-alanyl-D-alanine-endopeptidase (penicillin-binding protein 4)